MRILFLYHNYYTKLYILTGTRVYYVLGTRRLDRPEIIIYRYRTVPSESERTMGLLIKSFLMNSLPFFITKCHLLLAKFTPMNNLFGTRLALKNHAFFLLAGKPKSKCLE
jgi:hypothetical protein